MSIRMTAMIAAVAVSAAVAAGQSSSLHRQSVAELRSQASDQVDPKVEPPASLVAAPKPTPRKFTKQDLITVIIRDQASHSSSGNTSTERDSSVDASISKFITLNVGKGQLLVPASFSEGIPEISAESTRSASGSGTASASHTLVARIEGKIIDIKPNGTLLIEASKKITVDDDSYTITVTGSCRSDNVTPDNTILSTQVADLEITKNSTGSIKDATKRSWLHKLADFLNIF